MALATQCPHCHTTFRVAHDQLKLRAGLVRCGQCKQIFNGIENLLRPEEKDAPPSTAHADIPPPVTAHEAPETPQFEPEPAPKISEAMPPAAADKPAPDEAPKDDPLLRMTLMDVASARHDAPSDSTAAAAAEKNEAQGDTVAEAIDELQGKPWRRKADDAEQLHQDPLDRADAMEYEEPSFVRQGRRKQRLGRAANVFMACASLLLFVALVLQATYTFRNQIAARVPAAQPLLTQACARLGCQVGLPVQIDSVAIESSELQTLAADSNAFALNILLRNHSTTAQAWPNIELTLNDANEQPVARRVFAPRDYLASPQEFTKGLAAKSEQPFKIYFELDELKASGYRVYLFYP